MTLHRAVFNGPIVLPDDLPKVANRPFFARATGRQFEIVAKDDNAQIDIYDEIGMWGVSAKGFRAELKKMNAKTITVRLNSPGGDVFDGIAIHNDLLAHPAKIRIEVTGLAASAASIIAMAGDEIIMADNAFMMIHNAWGVAAGDKGVMADFGAILEKIDAALAATYEARTGIALKSIVKMMDDETWMSAIDAVDHGFADDTTEGATAKALFDLSGFKNVPAGVPVLASRQGKPQTPRDVERALCDAGYSRSSARATVHMAFPNASLCDAGHDDFTAALARLHSTIAKE